jgi:hypothetical protein
VEVADRDSEEAKDSGDGRSGSGGGWPEWIEGTAALAKLPTQHGCRDLCLRNRRNETVDR